MPSPKKFPVDFAQAETRKRKLRQAFLSWWPFLALVPHLFLAAYLGAKFVSYPDQDAYLNGANNILAGRGLSLSFDSLAGFVKKDEPTSYFGVGTQLFLAVQIKLFGENYFLIRLGNIFLFALSLLFFRGICRFWMSDRAANIAVFVLGVSPFYIAFNQLFLTEMPFIFCELGTFFFLFRYFRNHALKDIILSSIFAACSLLVRTNLLLFLPFIALAIAMKGNWRYALAYIVGITIVVSPYCIRNCLNNQAFFPFDGKAALNLWQFNSDVHKGSFFGETFLQAPEMPPLEGLTEKQRADLLMKIAREWIKENPARFLRFMAMKAVRFLSPLPQMAENRNLALLLTPYALFLLAGFFFGVGHLSWKDPAQVLIVGLFLYTLVIDMVFMSATRHRLLYDPFFLLVTMKWLEAKGWLGSKKTASQTIGA